MLSLENISYSIRRKKILQNINVSFEPGKIHMILGPNGSGKTSLLKIASGQMASYQGEIKYDQNELRQISFQDLAKYRAYLSQQNNIPFPIKVAELIAMGRYPHFEFQPSAKDFEIVDEVCTLVGINHLLERDYNTLSGGEQQRVQFARVLSQIWKPKEQKQQYLFLDEPLNNLDIQYQKYLLDTLQSIISPQLTVIMVVHDLNWAFEYAKEVYFMKEGELMTHGAPEKIINETLIQQVFNINCRILKTPELDYPVLIF